jgi:hypothetical protein
MLAQYLDLTAELAANNEVVIDATNYDYVVAQFVTPTGTIPISSTNDGTYAGVGATYDTNATNFATIQALALATGTAVTTVASAGLYKVNVAGRFIKFGDGSTAAAAKCLVMLAKIS